MRRNTYNITAEAITNAMRNRIAVLDVAAGSRTRRVSELALTRCQALPSVATGRHPAGTAETRSKRTVWYFLSTGSLSP
jgi:hypothetical protein